MSLVLLCGERPACHDNKQCSGAGQRARGAILGTQTRRRLDECVCKMGFHDSTFHIWLFRRQTAHVCTTLRVNCHQSSILLCTQSDDDVMRCWDKRIDARVHTDLPRKMPCHTRHRSLCKRQVDTMPVLVATMARLGRMTTATLATVTRVRFGAASTCMARCMLRLGRQMSKISQDPLLDLMSS